MSHQPFETWNLDRTNLSPEQQDELNRHIASCPTCKKRNIAWEAVKHEIDHTAPKNAPSSFAINFQKSLEGRRRQEHRLQVRRILIVLCASIAVTLIIMTGHFIATTPPAEWIGSAIRTIANVPEIFHELYYIITFWLSRIPPRMFLIVSVIPLLWLLVLAITGALTYSRFQHEGETLK